MIPGVEVSTHQGSVSPAETGRLAFDNFFPFSNAEKVMLASGASMSISSTSDMLAAVGTWKGYKVDGLAIVVEFGGCAWGDAFLTRSAKVHLCG